MEFQYIGGKSKKLKAKSATFLGEFAVQEIPQIGHTFVKVPNIGDFAEEI